MSKLKHIWILLLFFIIMVMFLSFCKKDNENAQLDNTPIDTSSAESIIIGDYTNMVKKTYDTILIGLYNNSKRFDIDLDNDNIFDFCLISDVWGSPAIGQHTCSSIYCLNSNCKIYGYISTDTVFLNKSYDTCCSNPVYVSIYLNHTCNRISANDSILKVQSNVLNILPQDENDLLKKSDIFKSDSVRLKCDSYQLPPSVIDNGDTIVNTFERYYNDCYSFPLDEIKYIGIKIIKNGEEKLGWIKLSISDIYKITILESAIQK